MTTIEEIREMDEGELTGKTLELHHPEASPGSIMYQGTIISREGDTITMTDVGHEWDVDLFESDFEVVSFG